MIIKKLDMRYRTKKSKQKTRYALALCNYCGKKFETTHADYINGKIKSCGCITEFKKLDNFINGFKVIEDKNEKNKYNDRVAIFECKVCKKKFKTRVSSIKKNKSCGCLSGNFTHNMSKTRLYRIWRGIIERTRNPNRKDRKYYFNKNITVCDEWRNSFENFRKFALSNGYNDSLTIDRIDINLGYSPKNCRFVNYHIQAVNKNTKIGSSNFKGVTKIKNKYLARICINGKRINIGRFETAIDAAKAYDNYIISNNLNEYRTNKDIGCIK